MAVVEFHSGEVVTHPYLGEGIVLFDNNGSAFVEVKFGTVVMTVSTTFLKKVEKSSAETN